MAQSTVAEPSLYHTEAPIQAPTSTTTTHRSPAISPRGISSSALTMVDTPSQLNPVLEIPPPGPAVTPIYDSSTLHVNILVPHDGTIIAREDGNNIWREIAETFEDLYQGLATEDVSKPAETNPTIAHTSTDANTNNTENTSEVKEGDLVLIDAGCEFGHYASDITRTFPASGKFSPEQKAIYEIVLKAQEAAIKAVEPGANWDAPHKASVKVITQGLVKLGLLKGKPAELIKKQAYRDFYMHRVGHWLGIDVHDVGDYKIDEKWRLLEPGMVTTIEPGIYISPDNTKVAKKWRGIGVRIEDDVLVTRKGHKILSTGIPKTVAEIETFMAKAVH